MITYKIYAGNHNNLRGIAGVLNVSDFNPSLV